MVRWTSLVIEPPLYVITTRKVYRPLGTARELQEKHEVPVVPVEAVRRDALRVRVLGHAGPVDQREPDAARRDARGGRTYRDRAGHNLPLGHARDREVRP